MFLFYFNMDYISVFMSGPHCFDYGSFILSFEIRKICSSFQICSSFPRLFWWIPHEFNGEKQFFYVICLVEKIVLWCCENWILICKWIKFNLYLILYIKINSNRSNLIFTSKCKRLNSKILGRQMCKSERPVLRM